MICASGRPSPNTIEYLPGGGNLEKGEWATFSWIDLVDIDSVVGSLSIIMQDRPCRQCGRNCTPGDKSCWWCLADAPC